jgi:hypothetical protein
MSIAEEQRKNLRCVDGPQNHGLLVGLLQTRRSLMGRTIQGKRPYEILLKALSAYGNLTGIIRRLSENNGGTHRKRAKSGQPR